MYQNLQQKKLMGSGFMICNYLLSVTKSWHSSLGIATGYELDGQGSILCKGKRYFSSPQQPDQLWGHLPSYPMGTGSSLPKGKAARM
jgi:hypothetical protein